GRRGDHPGSRRLSCGLLQPCGCAFNLDSMTSSISTGAGPQLDAASPNALSAFVRAAGLVVDEVSSSRVTGHMELGSDHLTPWGIVHGGVYSTAVESAASLGASTAVRERGEVAVGLTNSTHFFRSLSAGRVVVEATALYQGRT